MKDYQSIACKRSAGSEAAEVRAAVSGVTHTWEYVYRSDTDVLQCVSLAIYFARA